MKRNKLLIIIFILYILFNSYNKYREHIIKKEINDLYEIVNSDNTKNEFKDIIYLDSIRNSVSLKIKNSILYKDYKNKRIIDTLNTIKIKITKPLGGIVMEETAAAIFINMDDLTKTINDIKYFKNITTKEKYIILVNETFLEDDDLSEILTHEIYHGLDDLMNDISYNIELNKHNIIDDNIYDKKYLIKKVGFLYGLKDGYNELTKIILSVSGDIIESKEYLSSHTEIFARWKTFKSKLVDYKYIDNINSEVNMETIQKYLIKEDTNLFDLELLFVLNLDNLKILDKTTNRYMKNEKWNKSLRDKDQLNNCKHKKSDWKKSNCFQIK